MLLQYRSQAQARQQTHRARFYQKSGVGWQASWRLKPRLGGQRAAKPAYAGLVLANGSRRRPPSRRREPPSRRGFNRQLANPRFLVEPAGGLFFAVSRMLTSYTGALRAMVDGHSRMAWQSEGKGSWRSGMGRRWRRW